MTSNADPLVSVILPTFNERGNLKDLIPLIFAVLKEYSCDVIVVDDASPDGTAEIVESLQPSYPFLKLIKRPGKNGLSSAVFEGCEASVAEWVVIMDSDFSHDPYEIPGMINKAMGGFDVIIGSRFTEGSAFINQPWMRLQISKIFNLSARLLFRLPYRDLLTGFVVCRRREITQMPTRYSASGFKWLLELLATQKNLKTYEWAVTFHERKSGNSKANLSEVLAFVKLCFQIMRWKLRAAK